LISESFFYQNNTSGAKNKTICSTTSQRGHGFAMLGYIGKGKLSLPEN
jgi:dihydroxyacetone kinase